MAPRHNPPARLWLQTPKIGELADEGGSKARDWLFTPLLQRPEEKETRTKPRGRKEGKGGGRGNPNVGPEGRTSAPNTTTYPASLFAGRLVAGRVQKRKTAGGAQPAGRTCDDRGVRVERRRRKQEKKKKNSLRDAKKLGVLGTQLLSVRLGRRGLGSGGGLFAAG